MLQVEYLRHQSDALLRLSREVEEPEASAKLQELADELRIMVSLADVTSVVENLDRERPCVHNGDPAMGDDNGLRRASGSARTFSFTLLRSRRRVRRTLMA